MGGGAYPDQPEDLVECPTCARRMTPKALQSHCKSCGKTRKVFNMKKQRIDGEAKKALTDAKREERRSGRSKVRACDHSRARQPNLLDDCILYNTLLDVGLIMLSSPIVFCFVFFTQRQDQAIKTKAGKWKQESAQFREAMRAARMATQAEKTGDMSLMPAHVPSAPDPSLIPCPHCGRRFNETAAARHIPKCQDIKAKPSSLKRGTGRGQGLTSKPSLRGGPRR